MNFVSAKCRLRVSRVALPCAPSLRTQTATEIARLSVKRICFERETPRRLLSDFSTADLPGAKSLKSWLLKSHRVGSVVFVLCVVR